MRILIVLAGALALSLNAWAAGNACMNAAAQKKLAGAAKTAFMRKCMADSLQPFCEARAEGKKLHGAARNSFLNKCRSD